MSDVAELIVNEPISRQRRKQLRNVRDGLCMYCSEPRVNGHFCERHRRSNNTRSREAMRRRLGLKTRYRHAESYQFAA